MRWRAACVLAGLGALLAIVLPIYLAAGSGGVTPFRTMFLLAGSGDAAHVFLVQGLRWPRALAAMVVGAASGAAGRLIQTVARNRLATPAILGINEGATLAVLAWVFIVPGGGLGPWWLAPLGALMVAGLLVSLSGGIGLRGFRVLMVGIALSVLCRSAIELGLSLLSLDHATEVYGWSLGSFIGSDLSRVSAAIGPIAVLLVLAVVLGRRLVLLGFDLSTACALGADVRRDQWLALGLATGLSGLAVGIAGPVGGAMGFIALASPIMAGRLSGPGRVPVAAAALIGAIMVLAADGLARVIAAPGEVPAGAISSVLGGLFVLGLLFRGAMGDDEWS